MKIKKKVFNIEEKKECNQNKRINLIRKHIECVTFIFKGILDVILS